MKKPTFDFLALGLQDYQQDMADERKEKEAEQAEIKTEIELSWAYNPNLWYTDEQIKKEMEIAWKEYEIAPKKAYYESAMNEDYNLPLYAQPRWDFYHGGFVKFGYEYDVEADEVKDYFDAIKDRSHFSRKYDFDVKWDMWEYWRITHIEDQKDKIGKRYNALLREKRHVRAIGKIAELKQLKDECEDYQYLLSPDKKFNYVRGPVVHRRDASWHDKKLMKKADKLRVVRHKAKKHINKYKNVKKRSNKQKKAKKR